MSIKLLTATSLLITGIAAASLCTFTALITESCCNNALQVHASIPNIITPSGNEVCVGMGRINVDRPATWDIHVSSPGDGIDNTLSVAQRDNAVQFGWDWPASFWTEDRDSFDGVNGCKRTVPWAGQQLDCAKGAGADLRTEELACWFKCL